MMPETYTQEQIHDIATALYGWTALPRILPSAPGTGPDWDIGADIRAILSALSTAEQERDALKAQVAELEARLQGSGWISVEERLPEKETESCSVDCVICKEDGYQTLAYRYYGKLNEGNDNVWYDRVCRRNITGTVTHWMPLPESPAIVGNEEGV